MSAETKPDIRRFFKSKFSSWIVWFGVVFLLIESVWKMLFLWGLAFGAYWLFIFTDRITLPLIGITFGSTIILMLVCVVMFIARRGNHEVVGEWSLAFLLCALILVPTFFTWFPQNTIHVDTARIENQAYQRAVYPLFDLNYALYKCDPTGIFCRRVYRSGDILTRIDAQLEYDTEKHTLSILSKEAGEIYTYELP